MAEDEGKAKVTKRIQFLNTLYLFAVIAWAIIIGLQFNQEIYNNPKLRQVSPIQFYAGCFVIIVSSWYMISRACEIFRAFLEDSIDKLNGTVSTTGLKYGDRLGLAFKSYIELMIGFGVLYYVMPAFHFTKPFTTVFEAIYFSGVTMATVGYGDFSPSFWFTQLLVLLQIFCSLTLALVSFTVYTSLALALSSQANDK